MYGIRDQNGKWITKDSENIWTSGWYWSIMPSFPFDTRQMAEATKESVSQTLFPSIAIEVIERPT